MPRRRKGAKKKEKVFLAKAQRRKERIMYILGQFMNCPYKEIRVNPLNPR